MANYALLEWPENLDIGKTAPAVYVPAIKDRFAGQDLLWSKMMTDHALPQNWEQMDYQSFLEARRKLMAGIIRQGFDSLS